MSGYYENLTAEEQGRVLAAVAGLKLNAKKGIPITRKDVNAAFLQATGKELTLSMMRDPSVVQLMSIITPGAGLRGAAPQTKATGVPTRPDPTISITDRNLAVRGLPVPKAPTPVPAGSTRYSATYASGSRFGR